MKLQIPVTAIFLLCLPALAETQTITGPISAVNVSYGMQYPSITVNQTTIKLAPVWYLLDHNFEVKVKDEVRVVVMRSTMPQDPYFYAVDIVNLTTKASLTLRSSSGTPLWSGGGKRTAGGPVTFPNCDGSCVDPTTITSAKGTIAGISAGAGIQMPTLLFQTGSAVLTLKLGPERVFLDAGLELREGEVVTVRYATASCNDETIVLSITNSRGVTVVLRDDDGTPKW